jgi:hypothetical protein
MRHRTFKLHKVNGYWFIRNCPDGLIDEKLIVIGYWLLEGFDWAALKFSYNLVGVVTNQTGN